MIDQLTQDPRIVHFRLNRPQARVLTVMANETWLLWGRGTGKTQGVIAPWILHKVEQMPRSNGGLIGKTFADLETKILQPIFLAWDMLGYVKDEHYTYGKKPPEEWTKPLTPIVDWTHVVAFPNGTTLELISLHIKGSANGKSLQWIVADESKLLDENQLREEVFPILRGHVKHFGRSPWYGAKLFVSDKLSPSIHWILKKKALMDDKLVGSVIFFQLKLNEYMGRLTGAGEKARAYIEKKISKLSKLLACLRKNLVYYGEAKATENRENLGQSFFDNMKRSLTDWEYRISIDNEDPTRAQNGFYSSRTDQHLYSSLRHAEDTTRPVLISMDYQASISPLVVAQVNDMLSPGTPSLNFIRAMYVKHPLGMKHVIDDYCGENIHRPCKQVVYYYDHTAVGARNMHKKFYEEVQQYFLDNGWSVELAYMGAAPKQNNKYSRINYYLQQDQAGHYPIRIDRDNCASLVLSMDQTGTKEGGEEGTKKDKTTERDPNFPQEQSTHFSDAFDMLVWGVLELKLIVATDVAIGRVGLG